ncbi:MAG: Gfo/Idh/MocA family oxidoreductase [Bacillota bacterium]
MTDRLTVAVLGTGRMGAVHTRALQQIARRGLEANGRRVTLEVVLYGRNPTKLEALARETGVERTFSELDALWQAEGIDVVDNCLINDLHYDVLRRAIDRGLHVFTEKPLTIRLDQARDLLSRAERAGVHHGIVQNMRFQAGPARAKELIEAGALGRIFHVRVVFGYFVPRELSNRPAWFFSKEQAGGGIVHDMMAHFFDLISYLVAPIQSVACFTGTYFPSRIGTDGRPFQVDVEDAAGVLLRLENGAIADIFASWVRRRHEEIPLVEIDGEKGSVVFSFHTLRLQRAERTPLFRFDPTEVQQSWQDGWETIELPRLDPFEVQLEGFLKGILAGTPFRPDWHDAVTTQEWIERAYAAAAVV